MTAGNFFAIKGYKTMTLFRSYCIFFTNGGIIRVKNCIFGETESEKIFCKEHNFI